MSFLHLKIITPKKIVLEEEVFSVTIPTTSGEITVLPKHEKLFSIITEGIIKIKKKDEEDYLSIGGGYLETDGKELNILVSRAYGQNEIDEEMINQATEEAKKILSQPVSEKEKSEAISMMRRAIIDTKLLKKRKHKPL
ncbi:ATP synthase F1 subunit epsilon [Candidatus Roizmanbacteria bacterium CG_4_10_14_0_2_um_filter_36_35]|uniref:ATP synthase epsilon chain n=4 Tax=Candidatus Roizmaniibacteriota TaxID=1752723 RepID=A0A2M7BXR8_9BACT|nr:MAG: ATP synthase F1 subunit epsilon [Candidatus Roizmanbacteria bacterium CG11_big_fil_rev_8_21_14_0_20_35_14]PIV11362.1 MAG: ATP synthase F1 subunit epsilon [Candidatus Roizmanbacteria bacterium CG03_land_8_20_14_0_80_35_26]PIZ68758.1 MAG: ATP synthase F1 subunit epsilon [Candidatus Roizmanbacteria bacterium CG_4_10_14_0_2_um_filter_36_35]PJC33351.1 MAG: ATP synthase F1 subunit epsilon [Candidatus Roizmanbacteria bacterium CG_4_9_14_0_2_um_filter_36_12]PJC79969.1 MAG: ATP synthase F1 subun